MFFFYNYRAPTEIYTHCHTLSLHDALAISVSSGRAETEALIRRWRGRGRLCYAVTPRFALASSDAQLADAGALLAEHPDVLMHTHLDRKSTRLNYSH